MLVLITAAVLFQRAICLITLPDVGDPFDVAAEYAAKIPETRNAFVFFRQASAKLHSWPEVPGAVQRAGPAVGWSKADPRMRAWVENNREALELFRTGAEQADGWAHPIGDETAFGHQQVSAWLFGWLAIMEGSRLEEQRDMAGAWGWYRALLRMRVHVMRRGTGFEREMAALGSSALQQRVALWAADPATRVLELRRALDDVIASVPRPEWEASSLEVDYVLAMRELDRSGNILSQGDEDRTYSIGGEPLPPNLADSVFFVRRFLIREPERGRRVLRLAYANWLAHTQVPAERDRKPAVRATFMSHGQKSGVLFYAARPAAPAAARALPPRAIAQWLVTAPDAKQLLSGWPRPSIGQRERREHRALVVLLAEELYRRERGRPPASENELVGSYLMSLPDDGASELDDGTTPAVDGSAARAPNPLQE
jgi:hypothetical protein